MPRNTFLQLKQSRIPASLGLCADSVHFRQLANKATEALNNHGRFWGTTVEAQFQVTSAGLFAWPRVVADVNRINLCGKPIINRGPPWAFLNNLGRMAPCGRCHDKGFPTSACGCGALYGIDMGTQPVWVPLSGVPKYIKLYPRSSTDVGKIVLLQGYDDSNQWVRNFYSGVPVDGERVVLASPFALSSTKYSALTGAQKAATDMSVLVYSLDTATMNEDKLAEWQPDELNPAYRVTQVPSLGCGACAAGCAPAPTVVDVIAKLDYVPFTGADEDWLLISNLVAMEHGMRAQQLYEDNEDAAGDKEMLRAINQLNHELRTHTGDRTEIYVDLLGTAPFRRVMGGFR